MKFEKTEVFNFEGALRGMRNPLESWNKSDSEWKTFEERHYGMFGYSDFNTKFVIGKNDLELAQKLIRAGSVHRKFMRQIFVSVDITAPLYWWKEFDTYKVGTVSDSTSTMHKLASTPITKECFEMDDYENLTNCNFLVLDNGSDDTDCVWEDLIYNLERLRKLHHKNMELSEYPGITDQERKRFIVMAKRYWKALIRLLPESWLQTRTITMSYENVLKMIEDRKNHKLTEWSKSFIDWAKSLPYAGEMLFLI